MKLRYIIAAIASAAIFAGCQTEPMVGSFAELSVDKTFVAIPMEGGSQDVNLTAPESWSFAKLFDLKGEDGKTVKDENNNVVKTELPDWITADKVSGNGTTTIKFSAPASESGREAELQIKCGSRTLFLIVRQGSLDPEKGTCAEANAAPLGKNMTVTGKVVEWYSNAEQYGNFYIEDETAKMLVYGLEDKDGKLKNYPLKSWGIELGDIVTVQGAMGEYKGDPQMVNAKCLKVVKSLLTILTEPAEVEQEGGVVEVRVAFKGKGAYASVDGDATEWLTFVGSTVSPGIPTLFEKSPADTASFKFSLSENTGDQTRKGTVKFVSTSLNDENKTITTEMPYVISQKGQWIPTNIGEIVSTMEAGSKETINFTARLANKAVVSYVNGNTAYIEDESGAVILFKPDHGLTSGQTIEGYITGKICWYNGAQEMTDIDLSEATVADGGTIPETVITLADLLKDDDTYKSNLIRRVKIEGVEITDGIADNDRNGKIKQGETELAVYAQFKTGLLLTAGDKGDIIAIVGCYKADKQLLFWDNAWFTKK